MGNKVTYQKAWKMTSGFRQYEESIDQSDPRDIKLVVTDIDGTLTDGGMYYLSSGETFKRFDVRDGLGIKLLQAAEVEVSFVSSDESAATSARARRLGVEHCYGGVTDKVQVVENLRQLLHLEWRQVAFLGDDLQDVHIMRKVGLAAAVADAHPIISSIAGYTSTKIGGQGAFRELAEWLLTSRGCVIEDLLHS